MGERGWQANLFSNGHLSIQDTTASRAEAAAAKTRSVDNEMGMDTNEDIPLPLQKSLLVRQRKLRWQYGPLICLDLPKKVCNSIGYHWCDYSIGA